MKDLLLFVWPTEINGKRFGRYQRSDGTRYWKELPEKGDSVSKGLL